jgi:hypothetical protein
MKDDGKGSSVNIPTFLIGLKDGDILKESIHRKLPKSAAKNGQERSGH